MHEQSCLPHKPPLSASDETWSRIYAAGLTPSCHLQGWVGFTVTLLLRPQHELRLMSQTQQWQLTAQLLRILHQALLPHWHSVATLGTALGPRVTSDLVQRGQLPQLLACSLPPHAGVWINAGRLCSARSHTGSCAIV